MLVERSDHLDALAGARAKAALGTGQLVLVSGEAGVGKTTLLEALGVAIAPTVARWGRCDPVAVPRPLGAFADLDGLRINGDEMDGAYRVFEQLRDTLTDGSVLVLEDVHWADEATLSVLRLLGRRIGSWRGLIVATYRDDELDRRHPLWLALGDIASPAGVTRLPVGRLSRAGVAALAGDRAVDTDELYRLSSGNAFYVAEVLAANSEHVPPTVRDAVLARVARLDGVAVGVLEVVALAAQGAGPRLLEGVCPGAEPSVRACFDAGLLVAAPGGVAFRHELARLVVANDVDPARRRAVHQAILRTLSDDLPLDVSRLATHADEAADGPAVMRYAPEAAREAARLGAHREAASQYARALRFASILPPDQRAELLEARAEALFHTDEQVASMADLAEATALYREIDEPLRESSALCGLVSHQLCRGLTEDAGASAARALALAEASGARSSIARARRASASVLFADGQLDAASAALEEAHVLATLDGQATELALDIESGLVTVLVQRDGPAAFAAMEAVLDAALSRGDRGLSLKLHNNLAISAADHHVHDLADREIERGLAACEHQDLDLWRLSILIARAFVALDRCEWDAAAETGSYLADSGLDSPAARFYGLIVLALTRARRGDPGADDALALADATAGDMTPLSWSGPLSRARAEIAWLHGQPELVEQLSEPAYSLSCTSWAPWEAGVLSCWRARTGSPVRAARLTAEPCALELAGRFQDAADAWDALGCRYEAALAIAAAGDGDSLREAYERLRAIGADGAGAVVARQARALGVRGLATGPRQRARENPANLTARELDVLALLGEGLTNAAIAERLVVSPRTVDHHVSAVLRKLDVPTRARAGIEATRLGIGVPAR